MVVRVKGFCLSFLCLFVCLRGFIIVIFFIFQVRSDFSIFEGFFCSILGSFLVQHTFLCFEPAKQRKEKPKPKVLTTAFSVRINYGFRIFSHLNVRV